MAQGSTEEDLYEHHRLIVSVNQSPLRLDKYICNLIEHTTRTKIQQAAKNNQLLVNGNPETSNYKVKPGDVIQIMLDHPPHEHLLIPEAIDLTIVYEDDVLAVINKPSGLVVHPGHGNYSGTLVNGLLYHFKDLPENESGRPGLVHRIDKDTSGLLVISKTEHSMNNLAKQFLDRSIDREYVALVWGDLKEDQGTVETYIGRNPKNRLQMTVTDEAQGKHAVTHYRVLERYTYTTLVSCKLETGRTHQIRVHMKHLGHPLFNDERYGGNVILKGLKTKKYMQFIQNCFKILPRQALHAKTLEFNHPTLSKRLSFDSDLPEDFKDCLEKWKTYSKIKLYPC